MKASSIFPDCRLGFSDATTSQRENHFSMKVSVKYKEPVHESLGRHLR
jgi:hypothetical protein